MSFVYSDRVLVCSVDTPTRRLLEDMGSKLQEGSSSDWFVEKDSDEKVASLFKQLRDGGVAFSTRRILISRAGAEKMLEGSLGAKAKS